jgi:hypothetical protein
MSLIIHDINLPINNLKILSMKRLAVLSMTFLFALSIVFGQNQKADKEKTKETKKEVKAERVALKKLEGTNVNSLAKNNFNSDFKDAKDVEWKRIETYDKASFTTKDGHKMSAYYDINGNLVGTTQYKTFADLPENGQKDIKKNYKDYTIGQVVFYDDNENNDTDMILYGVQFEDQDNYFVELTKEKNKIILQVNPNGEVFFFKQL